MIWGYAGVWPGEYLEMDKDPVMARLKFIAHYGLKCAGISLAAAAEMTEEKRAAVARFLEENGMWTSLGVHIPYFEEDRELALRNVEENLNLIRKFHRMLRAKLVTTGAGRIHRFVRQPPLKRQLEMLSEALTPLAKGIREMGLPFGIENHGDYYCSDLAELCRMTPHMGIFLDTGNTYLAGERPLPAFHEAAPYTVGTHFKDHHVRPNPKILHFEIEGAILGEGDVHLRECYDILCEKAPNPDALVMEIEYVPPKDQPKIETWEKSLAFIRSLPPLSRRGL